MKILKWFLIVIAVLILLLLSFLYYMGAFKTITVSEKEMGPYTGIYESYTGDFSKVGQIIEKVSNRLKIDGVHPTRAFGIYYDDPRKVPADKLRSDLGAIIDDPMDMAKVRASKNKYKILTIAKSKSVVVKFPLKNMLSYMIGPMKAYPELNKYIEAKGLKVTKAYEIYDMTARKIYFVMQVI